MKLNYEIIDNIFILSVIGEVDANSAIELDDYVGKAIEDGYKYVLVTCNELDYISSAGLGVFISYIKKLKVNDGAFSFCSLQKSVIEIFNLLGLPKLVHIADSKSESIDYLKNYK